MPLDVQTTEGRAERDKARAAEKAGSAYYEVDASLPSGVSDWSDATGDATVRAALSQLAEKRGIPSEYASQWMKQNGGQGFTLHDAGGKEVTPTDVIWPYTYDSERRTLRVKISGNLLSRMEDDYRLAQYRASGIPGADEATSVSDISRLIRSLSDEYASPGEKALSVAEPAVRFAAEKGGRAADIATQPLQAIAAGCVLLLSAAYPHSRRAGGGAFFGPRCSAGSTASSPRAISTF